MIIRIKGSHEFFRAVCQHTNISSNDKFPKVTSKEKLDDVIGDIVNEVLDMVNYSICFPDIQLDHVDVFPADEGDEFFINSEIEMCEGNEWEIAVAKFMLAVEFLTFEIAGRAASNRLRELEMEVA